MRSSPCSTYEVRINKSARVNDRQPSRSRRGSLIDLHFAPWSYDALAVGSACGPDPEDRHRVRGRARSRINLATRMRGDIIIFERQRGWAGFHRSVGAEPRKDKDLSRGGAGAAPGPRPCPRPRRPSSSPTPASEPGDYDSRDDRLEQPDSRKDRRTSTDLDRLQARR